MRGRGDVQFEFARYPQRIALRGGREGKLRGQHADDSVRNGVERERLAERGRRSVKFRAPEFVAENHHAIAARLAFGGGEVASDSRLHAERIEEIPSDAHGGDLPRLAASSEREVVGRVSRNGSERALIFL